MASRLKAGSVNVNEGYQATVGTVAVPTGGMKEPGLGRRNGAEGLLKYTETPAIALRPRPPGAVPPRLWARVMTAELRPMRRIR